MGSIVSIVAILVSLFLVCRDNSSSSSLESCPTLFAFSTSDNIAHLLKIDGSI